MARPTPEQFPCIHRGDVLYQVDCGCGGRESLSNVYGCAIEGECTVEAPGKSHHKKHRPPTTQLRIPACISCNHRHNSETEVTSMDQSPEDPAPAAVAEEKKTTVREYRLKYTDDVKLPVKLTLTHLDSLEAGHPQRLPQFLMEALRGSLHLMEQDIVLQLPVES